MYTFKQAVGWLSFMWAAVLFNNTIDALRYSSDPVNFWMFTIGAGLAAWLSIRTFKQWRKM